MRKTKIILIYLVTIFSAVAGFGQTKASFSLPGILKLGTTSFRHKNLKPWYEENMNAISQDNREWGDNAVVEELLQLDTVGHHTAILSYNDMADRVGLLAFSYYEEYEYELFNKASNLDSIRLTLDRFIKNEEGINYHGDYNLFIGALGHSGELEFQLSKISSRPHITMDESTAPKMSWLDRWIKKNKSSYKIKEIFRRLDNMPLSKLEEPNESVMEVGLPEDLLPGQVRYGKFDVGYGSFKNLQYGGYLMESLERGDLKFYQTETAPLDKDAAKSLQPYEKDIRGLKDAFNTKAPLFTSALQNPAEDWYERTYYSVNLEEGIKIVLQIQVTFMENRDQAGVVKELTIKGRDQANYRDYCRYVLFQKKVAMPLAPVYEMEVDWKHKKTRNKE